MNFLILALIILFIITSIPFMLNPLNKPINKTISYLFSSIGILLVVTGNALLPGSSGSNILLIGVFLIITGLLLKIKTKLQPLNVLGIIILWISTLLATFYINGIQTKDSVIVLLDEDTVRALVDTSKESIIDNELLTNNFKPILVLSDKTISTRDSDSLNFEHTLEIIANIVLIVSAILLFLIGSFLIIYKQI